MCDIIDIRDRLHDAKIRRIAWKVIDVLGVKPRERDLVAPLIDNNTELNNWLLVISVLNRCFPSPTLAWIQYTPMVEDAVLELLVRRVNGQEGRAISSHG
jgi:hypothetical protein